MKNGTQMLQNNNDEACMQSLTPHLKSEQTVSFQFCLQHCGDSTSLEPCACLGSMREEAAAFLRECYYPSVRTEN